MELGWPSYIPGEMKWSKAISMKRDPAGSLFCAWRVDPWRVDPWRVDPWRVDPWRVDPWRVDPCLVDPCLVDPWRANYISFV